MVVFGNNEMTPMTSNLGNDTDVKLDKIPSDLAEQVNMDVEQLDVGSVQRKVGEILAQYGDVRGDTRRQALHDREGFWGYRHAERHRTKRKTLDMVQLLFMARQKLRIMETSEFFDVKSFGFRIAYAHRRSQRLWRNVGIIYTLTHHRVDEHDSHNWRFRLHHKAARMHVDFTYLFWLIMKLDVANKERQRRAKLLDHVKKGGDLPAGMSLPPSWG